MPPTGLFDLTLAGMQERLAADGVLPVHGSTLFQALHRDLAVDLLAPRDFPPPLRRWLVDHAPPVPQLPLVEETMSRDGWTRKFLLRLDDGHEIESVLMGFPGRSSLCVSTQAGCAMGCVFCATGQAGFVRNLSAGEIVAQVHLAERRMRDEGGRVRNVVLMGMGEPLHNFEAVVHALDIITDTRGLNIGPGRVTISTAGYVPGILRLADQPRRYQLAVSLHAASDDERSALVPMNRRWPLAELLRACRHYTKKTRQRVFIAWTLIAERNDTPEHARRLAELLQGMDVHINLIPLNVTDGYDGATPAAERVHAFQRVLRQAGFPVTIRQRRGIDSDAGCGQLRARQSPRLNLNSKMGAESH